ncbi:hypothetical protein BN946_scf184662.g9 [Trametes cinnabarina]|uniref:Uncharacterized protein n=1 Tax=Pycnoporus cinnabarinus TaxID=5643 RepID=A0A060SB27_PYCCI|nr:hypothetical protein BN946_scf184662.g9 [Trametes cinnabarina]
MQERVHKDNVINVDEEEEAVQEIVPPSKKRARADLPVLRSPTYSQTPSRGLVKAPFCCDCCASAKSADILCVLREGLPKCDRCFMQFTGCWAQKIPSAKVKSYAEWFDSQGYTRADAPDAAELHKVMAARGQTSDVLAWACEGASNSALCTPSQCRAAVPASASGSQPSIPHPKHRAEVVIVKLSKSTSPARARSIESEDEADDITMEDHSVHACFATPPLALHAPSLPSPRLCEHSPIFDAQNPLASPHLDLSSVRMTMIKATPIAHLHSLQAQAVEEDTRVVSSSSCNGNVESEEEHCKVEEDLEDSSANPTSRFT